MEDKVQSISRSQILTELKSGSFDVLIIGGGATGAGIALDAASRGLSTALIEMRDFASGTSSKSTKLIHGGLRYLKQLDIGLVRETGTERAILHRLAPHIILPEKMILPLIEGGTYGKWSTSIGLKIYDILAGVTGDDRRKMLSKKKTLTLEPLINEKILKGSGFYAEYRTDDARLSIEIIKTAARYGATVLNYIKAVDFGYEEGRLASVECIDKLTQEKFTLHPKVVVAAGGAWVDRIRKKDNSLQGKRLHLTKGVHIIVPKQKLPLNYTVYFDVPDGRMMFAIPRGRVTYIGTTDTNYTGDLNRIVTTKKDVEYILNSTKSAFPSIDLKLKDVISSWAGLRPLIHEDGKSPSELSRKDEIFISESGMIAIAGGKLTGYRKMAERVVDRVVYSIKNDLKRPLKSCQTKDIFLTQNAFKNVNEVNMLIKNLEGRVTSLGLDSYFAWYLVTNYGNAATKILDDVNQYKNTPEIALTRAELAYCLANEYVATLSDFYVRRTGKLYFEIQNINLTKQFIIDDLVAYFDWAEEDKSKHVAEFEREYKDATTFYENEFV